MFTSDSFPQKYERVVISPNEDISRQIPDCQGQVVRPLDFSDKLLNGPIQMKPFEAVATADNVSLFIDNNTSDDVWTVAGIATALQRPWNIIVSSDVELPAFTDGIATARFNSYRDIARITSSSFSRIKPRIKGQLSDLLPMPEHRLRVLPGNETIDFTFSLVQASDSLGAHVLPVLPGDPDEAYQSLEITNEISLQNLFLYLDYEMPMVLQAGKNSGAINHFMLGAMIAAPMQTHFILTKRLAEQYMTYAAGLNYITYSSYASLESQAAKVMKEKPGFLEAMMGVR